MSSVNMRRDAGFHLIESLVTLFVLTVGILGVAGLQAVAIRSHQNSFQNNQALILAQNMADRVRANRVGVQYYDQVGSSNVGAYDAACFTTVGCSSESMAHTDIYQWQEDLANALPGGKGILCRDSTVPTKVSLAGSELRTASLGSCDGVGNAFVIHVLWDKTNDSDIQLEVGSGGKLNPNTSDGYIQLVFEP